METSEFALGQAEDAVGAEVALTEDDHAVGRIVGTHPVPSKFGLGGDMTKRLFGTQDGQRQTTAGEDEVLEIVVDKFGGLIVVGSRSHRG